MRSFPGFGTVVSGTVLSGNIRRDDTIELLPSGKQAKVRFIEVHHERVEQAVAGQRVGLNLHSIALDEVSIGTVLAQPGILCPGKLLNAEISLLLTARRPVLNRQRVKLYLGTSCTTALVAIMQDELLSPGETGLAQLRLQEPLAVLPRDTFVISPMNLHAVIGGGRILEAPNEKFRAANAEKTLGYLQPLQRDDAKSIISLYFLRFPSRPVTAEEVVSATGLPADRVQAEIKSRMRAGKLLYLDARGYFDRGRYEVLKRQLVDITRKVLSQDAFKSAASGEEIRFRLDPMLDGAPFERMLGELCKEGTAHEDQCGISHTEFRGEAPFAAGKTCRDAGRIYARPGLCDFLCRNILEASWRELHSQRGREGIRPPSCSEETSPTERRALLDCRSLAGDHAKSQRTDPAKR